MKYMKKMLAMLLVLVMLMGLDCITAVAAADPTVSGIHAVTGDPNVTLVPLDKDGKEIPVDATTSKGNFYPLAEQVEVTISGATAGKYYMFFALETDTDTPKEDDIQFVDQATADGTVTCKIYPMTLSAGTTYYIAVSSNETESGKITALDTIGSFTYYAPYKLGDVNEDGEIDALDALMVLRASVHMITLNANQEKAADVTRDDEVDALDALKILRYSVHQIESL